MKKKPVRILHVVGIMNRGGAETMIMNLYCHIDRKKIQFDFVENSVESAVFDKKIQSLGGRIYRCPHYNGKNHFLYKKWWNCFFEEHYADYGAVHGHLGSTASIYLSIAKKYGIYTIAHSHNITGKGIKSVLYQAYAFPTRYIADYFFGCSMDAGISRYGKRVSSNPEKFYVLNNAIETGLFTYDPIVREQIRRHYNLENKVVIGHVGRFFAQKNHDFLIDVFKQVHNKNDRAVLLLVGDGELRANIQEKVKRLGLRENVIFVGVQDNVVQYYQAMDLFLLPSLYEGLGIVAVEAQSTGLQCIISDTVSKECIVTENQVTICRLADKTEVWTDTILKHLDYVRTDSSKQVKNHGYDIKETSKWLTNFYLEKISK